MLVSLQEIRTPAAAKSHLNKQKQQTSYCTQLIYQFCLKLVQTTTCSGQIYIIRKRLFLAFCLAVTDLILFRNLTGINS